MAFTTIGFNGAPTTALTMDAAFFSRPLILDQGLQGIGYEVGLGAGDYLDAYIGPFAAWYPQPFGAGVHDIFGDGSPELVVGLHSPFQSVPGSGLEPGFYWAVRYYTLEPGAAAAVNYLAISLRPGEAFGPDGAIIFGDLTGLSAPTTYLNELGPATVTPAIYYDREADNRILSAAGDDMLLGFGGNDTIEGREGADSIDGGDGNDLLYADFDFNTIPDGNIDTVVGGAGKDTLIGNEEADSLSGGSGNDLLEGFGGRDTMDGGKGNDTILGGPGSDLLTGGKGLDTFRYDSWPGAEGDKIKDFSSADDQIEVSAAFFGGGLFAGMDVGAAGQFVANLTGKAITPGLAQFFYDTDDGRLYWDIDGKGGGKAVLLATLTGAPSLTAADITVIA